PCTNCGTRATVTTDEPVGVPAASVPTLSGPSGVESTVPSQSSAVPGGSGSVRSSTVEPPPTAKPGPEPSYDEFPSATIDRRNSPKPAAGVKSTNPGPGPTLQGPNSGSSPATWNRNTPATDRVGTATS